jgi:all-trans-nonaprenyl-diphosphate synthase|uniref:Prenyl transferase n=1 Tax=Palmaria decipiens TaxID=187399 RepID=A0A6C0W1N5_PALDE|nr:Prenyl transferase [Palmaria decipiens]QIC19561.1 Prenyl transferase [Palmaria decipiens]
MTSENIFSTIDKDLLTLNHNLESMVGARHPVLHAASEHLFTAGGKRIRPAIVILIAKAMLGKENGKVFYSHERLAEITEIIHTASLVHDDIIDECTTRRGVPTVHNMFSTKIAVLAGDFLFAQSSWYLANLDNLAVVKTISKVITDFAEGEVRQGLISFDTRIMVNEYIEKSFYKTASLIAASCKGSAILSEVSAREQDKCYLYGKHLGLAFQIVDDILDIIGNPDELGKPSGSDLINGNLTAPILFALTESPELQNLIDNEFEGESDVGQAINLISKTQGINKAKDLAAEHIQAAINIFSSSKDIEYEDYYNLVKVSLYVLDRIN